MTTDDPDQHPDGEPDAHDTRTDAAAAFGLRIVEPDDADDDAERPAPPAPPCAWLWPENIPAWEAWHAIQSCWRTAGMDGRRSGIDWAGAQVLLQGLGYRAERAPRPRRLWPMVEDLRHIANAALAAWAEQGAK